MNQVAILRRKQFLQGLTNQGFRSGTAVVLEQSPHLTYYSAGETARRMLKDIETRPEFAEERAKIAELSELDELVTDIARNTKHAGQLKAIELGYRRRGALIDKSVNENTNINRPEMPASLQDASPEDLIRALQDKLKLSSQGIEAEPKSVEVTKV